MHLPPGPDAPEVGTTYSLTDEDGDAFDVLVVAWDPVRRIGTGASFPIDPILGTDCGESSIVAFEVRQDGSWIPYNWTRSAVGDDE